MTGDHVTSAYATDVALRMALEHRLFARSEETGVNLERLRRRVLVERIVARLVAAEPGRWVLKGGMALEVRLRDDARLTKDIDFGLRDQVTAAEVHERLVEAFAADPDGDRFVLAAAPARPLRDGPTKDDPTGDDPTGGDPGEQVTWRVNVSATLAGRPFGRVHLDVSARPRELDATDRVTLPNSLDFAGIPAPEVEIVDVHRHAAEKLHAMSRVFVDRDNSRVRDLVDVVILLEHDLLDPAAVAAAVHRVWAERDGSPPPASPPALPESWPERYERLAADHGVDTTVFADAVALLDQLWEAIPPLDGA